VVLTEVSNMIMTHGANAPMRRRVRTALLAGVLAIFAAPTLIPDDAAVAGAPRGELVRSQVDTVGFATSWADMEVVVGACLAAENDALHDNLAALQLADDTAWCAAIMPHDDYVYAGRTAVHLLSGLQAPRWVVFGVCHACRRIGVRDRLIFDGYTSWNVAGTDLPVDVALRSRLLAKLGANSEHDECIAYVDDERHAAEHSVEALLPWLQTAVPRATFVPVLVPGMDWSRLQQLADAFAGALAAICREEGWLPGRDIGILVSADAVHYGCEGWGSGGYQPFGCDALGHAAAMAQDVTLAQATLAGPLDDSGPAGFARLVWDNEHPEYPYKITWCGLYSIPFGLATAHRLQRALGQPPLTGHLLRYGDSVTDGRLDVPGTRLGVTAPNTLQHWVGYPSLAYVARPVAPPERP